MYISKYKEGITVFGGELYNLFSTENFTIEVKGNKNRPPFDKVFKPASQELLEHLYNEGSVYVEFVEDKKVLTPDLEEVLIDLIENKTTKKKVNKFS